METNVQLASKVPVHKRWIETANGFFNIGRAIVLLKYLSIKDGLKLSTAIEMEVPARKLLKYLSIKDGLKPFSKLTIDGRAIQLLKYLSIKDGLKHRPPTNLQRTSHKLLKYLSIKDGLKPYVHTLKNLPASCF